MDSQPVIELPQLFLPISLTSDFFIPFVFYVIALIYIVFTGILYYHWSTYTNDIRVATLTYALYFCLTLPPVLTMAAIALL